MLFKYELKCIGIVYRQREWESEVGGRQLIFRPAFFLFRFRMVFILSAFLRAKISPLRPKYTSSGVTLPSPSW